MIHVNPSRSYEYLEIRKNILKITIINLRAILLLLIGENEGLQLIDLNNKKHSVVFNSYNKIECLHKIKGNLIMAYSEKTLLIMKYITKKKSKCC